MEDTKLLTSDTDQLRIVGSAAEATGEVVVWLFKGKFLTSILAFLLTEVGGDKSKASEGANGLFLLAFAGAGTGVNEARADLSIVLMLLGNTSLLLFGLCTVLGLARFSAAVALCVQLGFAVLVFGILELVTALLGSVGASA